jgi:glycosyltransferase involved in cell wall biosynthesis
MTAKSEGEPVEPSMYPPLRPPTWPSVSVIIPCLNEESHIGSVIGDVLGQCYPAELLDVFVVDGGSSDKTRAIIDAWSARDSRVQLVENPDGSKPAGLNRGIRESSGDVVLRVDAHAEYASDYVRLCVSNLIGTAADNVGGFRTTLPGGESHLARAIARSISSRFGSGGAVYRSGSAGRRWVDTVFCGAYMRSTFDVIGDFDERLLRGQDREFNERLRRAGGRILFVPEIRVKYFARSDLRSFARWVYDGGTTPFIVSRLVGYRVWSLRNVVPVLFLVTLVSALALSTVSSWAGMVSLLLASTYLLLAFAFTSVAVVRDGSPTLFLHLFFVFLLTHMLYGVGSISGQFLPLRRDWVGS